MLPRVLDTSSRLLRVLALLRSRPTWTAGALAERLEVTERTVRRDIGRLRDLGYPIEATAGPHGGYELGRSGELPPLLLDEDEAVAVAIGLRSVATDLPGGPEEATVSALTKLESMLPPLLAARARAVYSSTSELRARDPDPLDIAVLVEAAQACRRAERVRFAYRDRSDRESQRQVSPLRLVRSGTHWYLVGFDHDREEWRTFRLDRASELHRTNASAVLNDPPDAVEARQPGDGGQALRRRRPRAHPAAARRCRRARGALRRRAHPRGADATIIEIGSWAGVPELAAWLVGLPVPVEVPTPMRSGRPSAPMPRTSPG